MAIIIPETMLPDALGTDSQLSELLRKALPNECAIWHASALELDPEERVPFLILGDEIGVAPLVPLNWQPAAGGRLATFWQGERGRSLTESEQAELEAAEARIAHLRQLLVDSKMQGLVDEAGNLAPAFHRVYVLTHFLGKDVTRLGLRSLAGHAVVLGQDELNQLYEILRQTTPAGVGLSGEGFNAIRLVVSPSIEVRLRRRQPASTLDGHFRYAEPHGDGDLKPVPLALDLQQEQVVKSFAHISAEEQKVSRDLDTRLIRGVVGSGKSLILLHRAKFLSQINPEWKILVLMYNRPLADFLRTRLRDLPGPVGHVEIMNFHVWCCELLCEADRWPIEDFPSERERKELVAGLSPAAYQPTGGDLYYLLEELDWVRDQGYPCLEDYLRARRRGRDRKLGEAPRKQIWELLQRYRARLDAMGKLDWAEVPLRALQAVDEGALSGEQYHAILVDEAQDFAPSWFALIQRMLKPSTNMLFLASDAAQKIYKRSLSWRALGIDVTGRRSRVLRRSYRNTYEILRVAYDLIGGDSDLRAELQDEGDDIIAPELDQARMRRGVMPVVLQFANPSREAQHIADEIRALHEKGFAWDEIAIICPEWDELKPMSEALSTNSIPFQMVRSNNINLASPDVKLMTMHASKGLEFTIVFCAGVNRLQPKPGLTGDQLAQEVAKERQLLYVSMTRARERLYISHTGPLPMCAAAALTLLERQ